jgi:hypothetical protein
MNTIALLRIALLLFAVPLSFADVCAADAAKLQKRTQRGDVAERVEALKQLGDTDAALAVETSQAWLTGERDARLRAAAARELWDLKDAARPAIPALRAALDDPDEDTVYSAIGALDTLDVPAAELREARLGLARTSRDAFHVFYSARALYPDAALSLTDYLDACFGATDLLADGDRVSDSFVRGHLQDAIYDQLHDIAKERGRAGFDALLQAWPQVSPPVRYQISRVLDAVPTDVGDARRIAALLDGAPKDVRGFLLAALGGYGATVQPVLGDLLEQLGRGNEPEVRADAASALARAADPPGGLSDMQKPGAWRSQVETRIAPALAQVVADDPTPEVRKAAAEALEKLELWGAPAAPTIAAHIHEQPDLWARYALVHVCLWGARAGRPCAREALQQVADGDADDAVRRDAREALATTPGTSR